ncbi:MAG TPA: MFS transporter, partial [Paracoccaceae bacterium]|nr:MFS transporter [Paracoccaceae bacterium]
MTTLHPSGLVDDQLAKRNVAVLVIAQAIIGAQMPMIFTIGGLAGGMLGGNPCFATLPISAIVFGSMTTAPWLSPLMQRRGRKFGFYIGALAAAVGSAISAAGLYYGSFGIFLLGSYLTGIYMSAQGFFRFAAADTASAEFRPKAISYVMAGGLVSALFGPQLNKLVMDAYIVPFLGSYLTIIGINIFGLFLFSFLKLPLPTKSELSEAPAARSLRSMLAEPKIIVSIIVAMVSYALMNLVMTSTPLAVVGCGYEKNTAADIVSAHVLAMYIPSFFTGHLVARYGTSRIMTMGLIILAFAGLASLSGVELADADAAPSLISFYAGLILLGVGWNFGFIGATTMLSNNHAPHERGRIQGFNDMVVFGSVTIASLVSGGLMNCSGGSP